MFGSEEFVDSKSNEEVMRRQILDSWISEGSNNLVRPRNTGREE
jgi:hypothetical protein